MKSECDNCGKIKEIKRIRRNGINLDLCKKCKENYDSLEKVKGGKKKK